MRPKWTGEVIKKMHVKGISQRALAAEMGCTPQYVCMVLSGARQSPGSKAKLLEALERLMKHPS